VFGVSVKISGEAGDQIAFKALQECEEGETAWVEIPVEGEEEPPAPAPMVTLAEAEESQDQPVALQNTAATSDGDGASTGLVVAALIAGGLGLLTGLAALLLARRRPTA
jgi:periplasmic copper chaperone A